MVAGSVISGADLDAIAGSEHVRPGEAKDGVDGLTPRWVVEPGSIEEAAAILRLASHARCPVTPRGSGTKAALGNIPSEVGLVLSTGRLNRLLEHEAGDLVATAEAGAPFWEVQAQLRERGQWLALDPPEGEGTIGGIIAANASGPHRFRYGAVRDQLIGLTYILPDGTVAKAGGKVVKNVAGYDLGKLFTGSLGTLGLIAEATFRLHPIPATSQTVVLTVDDRPPENLRDAVEAILHSTLTPGAVEFNWEPGGARLIVSFEGIDAGVGAQVDEAVRMLGAHGEVEVAPEDGDHRFEGAPAGGRMDDGCAVKIAALPGQMAEVIAALEAIDADAQRIRGHAGNGIIYADIVGDPEAQCAAIAELRTRLGPWGASVVVQQAPVAVKENLDVWGDAGDAMPLMRAVKALFDPNRIMNPGRYIGRL